VKRNTVLGYLLLLPHAVFFGLFVVFPLAKVLVMSFSEWGLFQGFLKWVGWENFGVLFRFDGYRAKYFWQSMGVTASFVAWIVPLITLVAILLAMLLNNPRLRFQKFLLTSIFLPTALAVTVTAVIWRWIFSFDAGLVNLFLSGMGLEKIPWITTMPWAFITVVIATLWWTLGWNVIILLGGLQKIPESLYDAARVDGANALQRFWNVTLPGLRNVLMYVVITQAVATFGIFGQSQLMTSGGPGRQTLPVMLQIYNEAFNTSRPRMGYASAMSVVFGVLVLSVLAVQYFLFTHERKGVRHAA